MKLKRILALLCISVLLAAFAAGCGKGEDATDVTDIGYVEAEN